MAVDFAKQLGARRCAFISVKRSAKANPVKLCLIAKVMINSKLTENVTGDPAYKGAL